jgi:superfamily I DNA/RNA helicase
MAIVRRKINAEALAAHNALTMASTALTPLPPTNPPAAAAKPRSFEYKPRKAAFSASPQQQAYFDWLAEGKGNAVIIAVAGSGKTTTLIQGLPLMTGSVLFSAYNKAAAQELKDRAQAERLDRPGLFIGTVHSACFNIWRRAHPKVVVDDRKVGQIIKLFAVDAGPDADAVRHSTAFIKRMVSFGKQYLAGVKFPLDKMATWTALAAHFSADQDLPEDIELARALGWVIECYRRSHAQCTEIVDFDDMIYAPIAHNSRFFQNDWVVLDEVQDINPARREAARRLLKPSGRFVGVGDDRQAIYGFTGAGSDAIERISEEFGCIKLPLTVSYRCPQAVIAYVQQWVSHIQAHPSAPEGLVRPVLPAPEGDKREWYQYDAPRSTDAILCRYTAPLLTTAYGMIKTGVACKVEGRDIGQDLLVLARRWRISSLDKLVERLETFRAAELAKAEAAESDRAAQLVNDKVDTLMTLIERCRELGKHKISDLEAEIEAMFADDVKGVTTLSTGHKAKGREWGRVYWIICAQRGRPRQEWEAVQEENVKYVIGTRAKAKADDLASFPGELILVPEPPRKLK